MIISKIKNLIDDRDKIFQFFLLLIMSAVCSIWLVEEALEITLAYDRYGYASTLVVIFSCLCLSYIFKKTTVARVIVFAYLTSYILWLTVITFFEASSSGNIYTLASTLQWVALIYIISFVFLSTRQAVFSAVGIFCVVIILLALAHTGSFVAANSALQALLLHAVLSQGVCIFCLFGVVKLKRTRVAADLYAEKMERAAHVDGLLGIGNRRMLQKELNTMASAYTPFSLLLIDVDFFKAINDTHGHLIGDDVLRELTECIKRNLRPDDTIGRWGGEEFLVLANGPALESALQLAERIRKAVEVYEFSQVGRVTISIGVAQFQKNTSVSQTFSVADKALYEAKHSGRNRVVKAA